MTKADDFVRAMTARIQSRLFIGRILGAALGYLLITLLLNNIRATASLWLVWPLIIVQFVLYFSIFVAAYQRSKALGLNATAALIVIVILTILGRVNDLEVIVIPVVVVGMLIWSATKETTPHVPA